MNKELPQWRRTAPETDTSQLFGADALKESLMREKQQLQEEREAKPQPSPEITARKEAAEQTRKREKLHEKLVASLDKHQLILGKTDEERLKSALQYANPEDLRRFYDTDSQEEENAVIQEIIERVPVDSLREEMAEQSKEAKFTKGRDRLVKTFLNLDMDLESSIGITEMLSDEELEAMSDMPDVQVRLLAGVYEDMYQERKRAATEPQVQEQQKAG